MGENCRLPITATVKHDCRCLCNSFSIEARTKKAYCLGCGHYQEGITVEYRNMHATSTGLYYDKIVTKAKTR